MLSSSQKEKGFCVKVDFPNLAIGGYFINGYWWLFY
jgi:hypothetical protein